MASRGQMLADGAWAPRVRLVESTADAGECAVCASKWTVFGPPRPWGFVESRLRIF
ncbi:hypothetical protein [Prauserella halophila]|nr:hypothetical protein [Prauserella halophila]